jgi:periplasmic copper chaperone A
MRLRVQLPCSQAGGPAARASYALGIALLAALALPQAAEAASDGLSVKNAWMRMIIPSRPAAGYFTLANASDKPQTLVGAHSPACGMLMLHQSLHKNGIEQMVMVKSVAVPAHGTIAFAPGGYHLMCMSPTKAMVKGKSVPVTLRFAGDISLTADFAVRSAMGQ